MKSNIWATRCVLFCFVFWLFMGFVYHICLHSGTYFMYDYSEMMINYEGGFVRRGLAGQVLFGLCQAIPCSLFTLVKAFNVIVSISYLWLILHIFRKEGWSPMVLCLGCGFLFIAFNTFSRKDFLLLLLAYYIYSSYKRFVLNKSWKALFLLEALSILQLLMHEAAFFFTYPILMVWHCLKLWQEGQRKTTCYIKALIPFLPILFVFFIVSLFKGDEQVAQTIWQSWRGVMMAYPDGQNPEVVGLGVNALTWKALPTFLFHLRVTYLGMDPVSWRTPIHVILQLANFGFVYYFATRINMANPNLYPLTLRNDGTRISNFLIIQFVFMLPMFTILSCDSGRTFPYWVLSSLMACHVFGHLQIPFVVNTSKKLQLLINKSWLNKSSCYLLLMLLVPIPPYYAPGWMNSPIVMFVDKFKQMLEQLFF